MRRARASLAPRAATAAVAPGAVFARCAGVVAGLGGKWQLTTYPPGGGGYSLHTDCVSPPKPYERQFTAIVYLTSVAPGGMSVESPSSP